MAISLSKYVDITSGVGGAAVASSRTLVGRLFTANALLPTNTFLQFTDAASVGTYFGTTSEEYLRAVFYFSWVSKNITTAQSIQYARWANVAVSPTIRSVSPNATTLSLWNGVTSGSFGLTIGGVVETFSSLDFSADASLTAVAARLQAAVRTGTGDQYTLATVVYNALTSSFDFTGGEAVDAALSIQVAGGGTDITGTTLLGWLPVSVNDSQGSSTSGAVVSDGSAAQTVTELLTESAENSNNFGSFLFLTNLSLTVTQAVEAAEWNALQNVAFMFTVAVTTANVSSWSTALSGIGGVGLTVSITADQFPEQMPMMIAAATNYAAVNSVQNYMFQMFNNVTASVTTNEQSAAYDDLSVNYYGSTQTAGQLISFYQRGLLQGSSVSTNIVDMNTYVNEMWLKDAAAVSIINLLLGLAKVSANEQGRGQILSVLQEVINLALTNGTISVGKTLTAQQKSFITTQTNDNKAWYQVQNSGYWLDSQIAPIAAVEPTQYEADYTLIYSKDDVIRKVVGTQILI